MRQDLAKLIRGQKGITNAVILTHNIDFVFLQSVVLSALRQCGRPTLTVFADAHCATSSFAAQAPVLSSLGRTYRVVMVPMPPGFRFHPKALLLSGVEKAFLAVGSGNLTFGGWRGNAEVWTLYDSAQDGTGPFGAFQTYLRQVLGRVRLGEYVTAEVLDAFGASSHPWAAGLAPASDLVGKAGSGEALLDAMLDRLGTEPVSRVTVCSPYFDADAEALRQLVDRLAPAQTEVVVEERRSGLLRSGADQLHDRIRLRTAAFEYKDDHERLHQSFIHAKFYAFEQGDRVTVFAGSANCSRAALTIPGGSGNFELLAARVLTRQQFREEYLGEFRMTDSPPVLPDVPPAVEVPEPDVDAVRITAARFDGHELQISFTGPPHLQVTRCLLDGVPKVVEARAAGLVATRPDAPPRTVQIEGQVAGHRVQSALSWADHEPELRNTARMRGLVHLVSQHLRPDQWRPGALIEMLEVLTKNVQYLPARRGLWRRSDAPAATVAYTEADVFIHASRYRLPTLGSQGHPAGWAGQVTGLQQLVYRWLGHPWEEEAGDAAPPPVHADEEEGSVVDRQEELLPPTPALAPPPITERERTRVRRTLERVAEVLCDEHWLGQHEPENLGMDLCWLAALMRAGLCAGWVEEPDLLNVTHRIWSSWFFSGSPEPARGWLDWRCRSAEEGESFAARMTTDELAAALAGWALAVPQEIRTATQARFALACVVSVARLPWLWYGKRQDVVKSLLLRLLETTTRLTDRQRADVTHRWGAILRRGEALRLLERSLARRSVEEVHQDLPLLRLAPGDLLWQGSIGFCMVTTQWNGTGDCPVLKLQRQMERSKIAFAYVTPVRALLDQARLSEDRVVDAQARIEITALLAELTGGLRLLASH